MHPSETPLKASAHQSDGLGDTELDLELNEMTQEDKFFLIQQIEDLNKNIRYYQNSSPVVEEEDEAVADGKNRKQKMVKVQGKIKAPRKMSTIRGAGRLDIILDEEEELD